MDTIIERLQEAGAQHKGTDLGGLLQWAALHIACQDEAMAELRKDLETEERERLVKVFNRLGSAPDGVHVVAV